MSSNLSYQILKFEGSVISSHQVYDFLPRETFGSPRFLLLNVSSFDLPPSPPKSRKQINLFPSLR